MDGMHRVTKAILAGRRTIAAVHFAQDPAPDFVGVQPEDLPYDGARENAGGSPGPDDR